MTIKIAIYCILLLPVIWLSTAVYGVELPDEMDAGDKAAYLKLLENFRDDIKFGRSLEVHHIYENAPPVEGSPAVYVYNWKESAPLYVVNTIDKNGRIVSLNLYGKLLKDLSLLKPFSKLKYLSLEYNLLKSIESLPFLAELEEIHLNNNFLTEIPKLDLPKLRILDISENAITNLEELRNFHNLQKLIVEHPQKGSGVHNLSGLEGLIKLKELNLEGHPIESVDSIYRLINLQKLNLGAAKLERLGGILKLVNLVDINLSMTNIISLAGIQNLKKLKVLNISGTKITDLTGIEKLHSLEVLYLFGLNISSLKALENLSGLKEIGIARTKVTDFYPLLGLKNLQSFKPPNASIYGGERPDAPALSMEQRHVLEKIIKRGEENYKIAQEEKYRAERKAEVKANKAILRVKKKVRAYKAARKAKE